MAKTGVLADHKRMGKRFVPPMLQLGIQTEPIWANRLLPEILWIGLLIEQQGLRASIDLTMAVVRAAKGNAEDRSSKWFCLTSEYATLDEAQQTRIVEWLDRDEYLTSMQYCLRPLAVFYPAFPLRFLYTDAPYLLEEYPEGLDELARVVGKMYNRRGRVATLAQTTALYSALVTGLVTFIRDCSLTNLEPIVNYPDTDESRMVAASVRATWNGVVNLDADKRLWPDYFWNRGMELTPCLLEEESDD